MNTHTSAQSTSAVTGYRRSIAGVVVDVVAAGCLIDNRAANELAPFASAVTAPADMIVTVTTARPPDAPAAAPHFSTESWDLWHLPDGGCRIAFLRSPNEPRPIAIVDREATRATYFHTGGIAERANGLPVIFDPFRFPLDQLLFIQHLAYRKGFIVHAAGIAFGQDGIVVPGVSGAGKSTLTGLVTKAVPDAVALSDERIILCERNGRFDAWGTPWVGTAGIARNENVPARAVVFLAQDTRTAIAAIPVREALRRLFGVLACPWYDAARSTLVLAAVERLVQSVPTYELRFARDPGVADVLLDLVQRETAVQ